MEKEEIKEDEMIEEKNYSMLRLIIGISIVIIVIIVAFIIGYFGTLKKGKRRK